MSMRWTRAGSRRMLAVALVAAAGLTSCQGEDPPSFSISAEDATATLAQGATGTLLLTVTRNNNYTADINLELEGILPDGVTAEFSQNPVPDGEPTVNIAFTIPASITPGNTELTVKATGEGAPDQTLPITLTVSLHGTHTVSLPNATLTVAQGGGGSATVSLPRTDNNAGLVTLSASAPSGITATFGQSPTSGTGTTIAIAAAASVPVGNHTVTITASQTGVSPNPQATLTVAVVAPKPTTDITLAFCNDATPDWVGYQNEGFNWRQVQPAGNLFSFAATDKVGLAFTFLLGNATVTQVMYATRQELAAAFPQRTCFGTRTLTGTAAGIGSTQTAFVSMGFLGDEIINNAFTLDFLPPTALDVVSVRGAEPDEFSFTPDKMIVRRGVTQASGALPALDFSAGEAFDPASMTVTLTGLGNDGLFVRNNFAGATGSENRIHSALPTSGTFTTYGLPAARAAAGDVHQLYVETFNSQSEAARFNYSWYSTTADRSVTLAPNQNVPTVSVLGTAPYVRFRGQLDSQSQYSSVGRFAWFQAGVAVQVEMTAGFAGGLPSTWDVSIPDLTSATGFSSTWMMQPVTSGWIVQAMSGRAELVFSIDAFVGIGADPIPGDQIASGYRQGTVAFGDAPALRSSRSQFPIAQRRLLPGPKALRR